MENGLSFPLLGVDSDNAHIEQKNRIHVRELLGEDRLDDPARIALIHR